MGQTEVRRQQIELYTRMLGCVVILITGGILKNEGIAFVAVAYECMMVFWTLAGNRASEALRKMLKARAGKGQYRNMEIIGKNILFSQFIVALLESLLFAGLSKIIAEKLVHIPYIFSILLMLTPVLFLRILSETMIGRFEGEGHEMLGVLIGQILLACTVLLFANLLTGYGEKVANLLEQSLFRAMYGGLGVAIALDVTELVVVIVLVVLLWKERGGRKPELADGMKTTDSFRDTLRIFYGMMSLTLLIGCLEQLGIWVGTVLYIRGTEDQAVLLQNLGVLYGKYFVICILLILPVCAGVTAMCGRICSGIQKEDRRLIRRQFQNGVHISLIHGLFFSAFLMVMAEQIAGIFGGEQGQMLTKAFQNGSWVVTLMILNYFFLKLLVVAGKRWTVFGCLAAADCVFAGVEILLRTGEMGDLSLVYGLLAASLVAALSLGGFCMKALHCSLDWVNAVAVPVGAALVTAFVAFLAKKLLAPHIGDGMAVAVIFLLAAIVYWVILFMLRNVREQELKITPVGRFIYALGHLAHLV